MKPIHDLICQLQLLKGQMDLAASVEQIRKNPPPARPKDPGLDLSWFDLNDPATRSLLLNEPKIPEEYPLKERFSLLISQLILNIRAARMYLQIDAYPQALARMERLPKFEVALERLEELSQEAKIEDGYYLDHPPFLIDDSEEYCWDCASAIISRTRIGLMFVCFLLSRRFPRFAQTLWERCDRLDWWSLYYSRVRPCDYSRDESDGPETCECCYTLLNYSLTGYGTDEEADHFLSYEGEMDSEDWWQLKAVFEGAEEQNYPNFLADKLDKLIEKYQLDSPRRSVTEES